MISSRSTLLLGLAVTVGVVACQPGINHCLTESCGDAPLVVNLDTVEAPNPAFPTAVVTTAGFPGAADVTARVRAPNFGKNERGGITGSFVALTTNYCIVSTPQGSWPGDNDSPGANPNAALQCGDSNLHAGLASNYTGTPGVSIGDFQIVYTDAVGVQHIESQDLCIQHDLFGNPGAQAGPGATNFCTIPTVKGSTYLVDAETISVPLLITTNGQTTSTGEVGRVALAVAQGVCPSTVPALPGAGQ